MSLLNFLYDDSSSNILYLPPNAWSVNSSISWTQGHSMVVSQPGLAYLQFSFEGVLASFYGVSFGGPQLTPVIDDFPQVTLGVAFSQLPSTYGVWYRTPLLEPGFHKVELIGLSTITLDYIVVQTYSNTTTTSNTPLLITNTDPIIHFSGTWQAPAARNSSLMPSHEPFDFSYDNPLRSTCNAGDTLTLNFSGPSIEVWGAFDWTMNGHIIATYIIDGAQMAQREYQSNTSAATQTGFQPNFNLYSQENLTNEPHNIVVDVTTCFNQMFYFDYIIYTPVPAAGGSTAQRTSHKPSLARGVIGGIVVSVVAFIIAGIGVVLLYRKRQRQRQRDRDRVEPVGSMEPFDGFVPTMAARERAAIGSQSGKQPTSERSTEAAGRSTEPHLSPSATDPPAYSDAVHNVVPQ